MELNSQMKFLTDEELLSFFHRKKTEISCIDQPHIFLTQLKDHDLLPDKLFKKVKRMRTREQTQRGIYEVLDWLEKEKSQDIRRFWSCVFQDPIIQKYPTLRLLKKSLLDVINFSEEVPDVEMLTEETEGKGKKGKQMKNTTKRSFDDRSNEDSGGPGPSSASTSIHKKPVKKTPLLYRSSEDSDGLGPSSASTPTRKKPVKKTPSLYRSSEDSDGPGPSSASTPTRKKPVKKTPSPSTVKKGDKQEIWTLSKYKAQLPVKCGDEEGTLHRDKLAKGEKCILSQKRWFTPSEFEKFGGKERSKNWKLSIRCGNTPLKSLIEKNHLQCSPMKKRKRTYIRKSKKVLLADCSSDCSSQESRPDMQDQFRKRVDEEEEEEGEMSDLTVFQPQTLPVTCGSLTGTLNKKRFASGRRGKSIRTEERWFTPEEFVKEEPTLTDGLWKRDILCHGKTLNFLFKKKILHNHSLLCECVKCSTDPDDLMEQNNDDECYACHSGKDLVCCDECPRAFHSDCHLPAVYEEDTPGEWFCTFCVLRTSQQWRDSSNMSEQEAFDAPVSQNLLQCHYLLLCMYKEDIQGVFVEDPRRTVERYAEFTSQPMWLDRIKRKLETNKYQKVGEFISDFQLIFNNSSKFNQDNKFDRLATTMKEIFKKEMQKIFSIQ